MNEPAAALAGSENALCLSTEQYVSPLTRRTALEAGWLVSSELSQAALSVLNLPRAETSLTVGDRPSRAIPIGVVLDQAGCSSAAAGSGFGVAVVASSGGESTASSAGEMST